MFRRWKENKTNSNFRNEGANVQQSANQRKNAESLLKGHQIERRASQWLEQQGLSFLQFNYSCRYGEIDIVMKDNRQLVFVEVRYRKHISYGGAAASVDRKKQKKLLRTAEYFLSDRGEFGDISCRFDVIAAQANTLNADIHWTWIKNAFAYD